MISVMDETFMGAKNEINGRWSLSRFRYQPVLAVLLLPSLLLIGIFSYYPAVRSLIGGFAPLDRQRKRELDLAVVLRVAVRLD